MPRTTQQLRDLWAPPCRDAPLSTLTLWSGVKVAVRTSTLEAWRAFDQVTQAHRYRPLAGQTGAYNCRPVTGGSGYSLHAYGTAVDLNWNTNPYRRDGRLVTDYPPAMIRDLEEIRTVSGDVLFAWGGRWPDPVDAMHWQVDATPDEVSSGVDWTTVAAVDRDETRSDTWPVLESGDSGPTVAELQARLNGTGARLAVDGEFGPATLAAVEDYQRSRRLTVDGIVGPQTWTALLTDSPPDPDESPVKIADPEPAGRFVDVHPGHTFAAEIERAADAEILAGWPDGTFRPGDPLTRAAAAAMVSRLLDHVAR